MEFITSKKSIIVFIIYVFFSISSYSQNTSSSEIFCFAIAILLVILFPKLLSPVFSSRSMIIDLRLDPV